MHYNSPEYCNIYRRLLTQNVPIAEIENLVMFWNSEATADLIQNLKRSLSIYEREMSDNAQVVERLASYLNHIRDFAETSGLTIKEDNDVL